MKEYGMVESWSKLFVINSLRSPRPLCFTGNKEVLAQVWERLVVFNVITGDSTKEINVQYQEDSFLSQAAYVESLVLPKIGGRIEMLGAGAPLFW